ncbi:peptidoglycan-binding domain-containing protein [Conexibacter stalactiti]|uniref:Peptidoglycan-binding domain-containing protein n=1 Tax=Conexibacter stalactiti TaxID=1940611 RepID=A0ABU4HWA5_9ACTN|nr:peptidoglycan-binding domain-containing protein [Conexibacter stalactiti]MDW5597578.1 peptidoglycan-binding domain-containing protein [Conexibacter stalactiti]MEC5038220.1 peptidoglycan-binding domain-containing protein [Conexibacter stalactiti]
MHAFPRHLFLLLLALAGAVAVHSTAASAQAALPRSVKRPKIVFTRCSSTPYPCQGSHKIVVRGGKMLVGAGGMNRRAKVEFPVRSSSGKAGKRRVGGSFRSSTRLLVSVPKDAVSGAIRIVMPGPKYSNAVRITVRKPPVTVTRPQPTRPPVSDPGPGRSVFDGSGMWIWYLRRAAGGDAAAIAEKAAAAGVRTIFLKSADGSNVWSQFSQAAIAELKATGLNVCGWQFVYGNDPIGEAQAAAASKAAGADCFVIDAEGAYEGKYAQAQRYTRALRAAVGDDFPIGLTSFPYVHYHPGFPYSVFMAPGGATFNLPQVYWKTIGTSVDTSLQITYQYNTVYETPIYPLGQTYDGTAAADVRRFRQLSLGYGATGVSWWVWDFASASDWGAVGAEVEALDVLDSPRYPTLRANGSRSGSRGDLVVLAQQHLNGAGASLRVDGDYGPGTAAAVRAYQASKGITESGVLDEETWPTLLRETPVIPNWAAQASKASKARASARSASAARAGALPAVNGPASAGLRARRNEIPAGPRR